jgi:hypothetical protein
LTAWPAVFSHGLPPPISVAAVSFENKFLVGLTQFIIGYGFFRLAI